MPSPPLTQIPSHVVALEDYEALARTHVNEAAWAYISGGSADERTLRENHAAFERLKLLPRVLGDFTGANTAVSLLGRTLPHPVIIAPTAFHRLMHPDGELATVLGAAAMEACTVVSTSATVLLEDLATAAKGPLWFQLYMQPDSDHTLDLIRRAELAGYEALVVTVDAPVNGLRNREQRANFQLPPGLEPVNLRGRPALPMCESVFDPAYIAHLPQWQHLVWLREHTKLPILLKGILAADDAARALDAGVEGLIVSNHGGRTLDGAPASIEALPRVAERVSGQVPVIVDGGIRRGTDVLKALALGADAVMVGRPILHGLAVAGPVGVAHVLKILRTELEIAMLLCGCPTRESITKEVLWG
ncbi:alpha-hydroxy acid oxidase [Luteolibacter sp. LG18]|uniref:alpha-hydroxy acid oxidase n=1 Tax=Luteolibacter sp. LG18 TaxID=2819286 RepID=UPI002B2FBF59|nr:alpha-hydroxy-acid oxidizing enzyme [Luteolibacter sp. LG18]